MFEVSIKSPEGETVQLISCSEEQFALGAQAGIAALLKFLEVDMDFEEGYSAEISRRFETHSAYWKHPSSKEHS